MKLKIFFSILVFIFLFWGTAQPVSAAVCPRLGTPVDGKPSNHQYTSQGCSGLANEEFGDNLKCIGTTGCRYWVFYCSSSCLAKYDVQDCSTAPALCNRSDAGTPTDISKIFGIIDVPQALQDFGFGSKGISTFLSNGITLIYSFATIVLIFMLLWGAFEWMTSGGDKEKLSSAQKRIISAIVGILLFGVAFAVIRVLGTFTGFKFFN